MDEIKRLIESRHVKAVLDKVTHKLTIVAEYLGSPIVSDGEMLFDGPLVVPDWGESEEIRTADGDSQHIGFIYDGLKLGHNLEIRWLSRDADLRATFNGHIVYHEAEGELQAYVPRPEWEDIMNRLYEQAKPIAEHQSALSKEKEKKRLLQQAGEFVQKLRTTWGF